MPEQTSSQRWSRVALPLVLLGLYSTLAFARTISNALRDANLLRVSVGVVFGVVTLSLLIAVLRSHELRRPRVLIVAAFVALAYGLVVFPMESPEEKLHFVEYGVVGVLAFFASPLRWSELRRILSAALFTGAAGWLEEGIQALLPSRYYDLRDVGFNALAGVMALSALALVRLFSRG